MTPGKYFVGVIKTNLLRRASRSIFFGDNYLHIVVSTEKLQDSIPLNYTNSLKSTILLKYHG